MKLRLTLLAILFSLFIISCDDDDSTNFPEIKPDITANITGDLNFEYKSYDDGIRIVCNDPGLKYSMYFSSVTINNTTYYLAFRIETCQVQAGTYDLTSSDSKAIFYSYIGTDTTFYDKINNGQLILNEADSFVWRGTFNFSASTSDNSKTVQFSNGIIKYPN